MFEQLVESGPRAPQGWSSSVSSVAVHAGLFAVVLLFVKDRPAPSTPPSPVPIIMEFPGSPPVPEPSEGGTSGGLPVVVAPVFPPGTVGPVDTPVLEGPAFPVDSAFRGRDLAREMAGRGIANPGSTDWLGAVGHDSLSPSEPPLPLVLADPIYPPTLRAAGVEGSVTIEYVVGTDGLADSASVKVIATDFGAFGEAATRAVLLSRFRPGRSNGLPVAVRVRQLVRFLVK